MENIQDLEFPNAFLWNDGRGENIITGIKQFENTLVVNVADVDGTINNIDPARIITLSGDEFIPGTTTFRQLEVTKSLEVGN